MRIRKHSIHSVSATTSPSSSSSSFGSSITTHSIASSTDSSSSFPSSFSTRCRGLDLLVKAIHCVSAGSVVGVPYIQRRIVRRRRRALRFDHFIITQLFKGDDEGGSDPNSIGIKQRRVMALPFKLQDSVLQPWRPQKRSSKIN